MHCQKHDRPGVQHLTCPDCVREGVAVDKAMTDPNVIWCGMDAGSSDEMCGGCQFREKATVQVSRGVFEETDAWRCHAFEFSVKLEYAPTPKLWRCQRTKFPVE